MDSMTNDIKVLANLFKECDPSRKSDSESDEDLPKSAINPGDLGASNKKYKQSVYTKLKPTKASQEKFDSIEEAEGCLDSRKEPNFEITYRQAVTSEDIFLQMGRKNPSTASCEDMIIKIELPEEDHIFINLEIEKEKISLDSPKYKLNLTLPQHIDPQKSSAKWYSEEENLILCLRMDREFDFINF